MACVPISTMIVAAAVVVAVYTSTVAKHDIVFSPVNPLCVYRSM